MTGLTLHILGGAWVGSTGFGHLGDGRPVRIDAGAAQIPRGKEVFETPLPRYGRFDRYTRLGCAGIGLALRNAGLDRAGEKRPLGMVLASTYDCLENDLDYYKTTQDQDGLFSSPNLFSYTLPGIVLGECAIHFKCTGPTLVVGQEPGQGLGLPALQAAAALLQDGLADTMVAGWLDNPPRQVRAELQGAVLVVLTADQNAAAGMRIEYRNGRFYKPDQQQIGDITDLFEWSGRQKG